MPKKSTENEKILIKEKKKEKQMIKAEKKLKKKKLKCDNLSAENPDVSNFIFSSKCTEKTHTDNESLNSQNINSCDESYSTSSKIPISKRTFVGFTQIPTGDIIFFGGEYFDGKFTFVYNDLFIFNPPRLVWKKIQTQITPKARCAHQLAYYNEHVYMFGGEFYSNDHFEHLNDFWKFNLKSNTWTEITDCTGTPPSPRSGHRMVVWRNILVLFGGFYDNYREYTYFNDLYLYHFHDNNWRKIVFDRNTEIPCTRSGFNFFLPNNSNLIYLYGGYIKVNDDKRNAKGIFYDDLWALNMINLVNDRYSDPTWEWTHQSNNRPSPRTGASMTVNKNLAILFGGAFDEDDGGLALRSIFYNDLFAFDLKKRKWYALNFNASSKLKSTSPRNIKNTLIKRETLASNGCEYSDSSAESTTEFPQDSFGLLGENGKLVMVKRKDVENVPLFPRGNSDNEEQPSTTTKNDSMTRYVKDSSENFIANHDMSSRDEGRRDGLDDEIDFDVPKCGVETANDRKGIDDENENSNKIQLKRMRSVNNKVKKNYDLIPKESFDKQNSIMSCIHSQNSYEPLPRIRATTFVNNNNLYLFGGILEIGNKETILDDLWFINLNKRERWERIYEGTMHERNWIEMESSDSDTKECNGSSDVESSSVTDEDTTDESNDILGQNVMNDTNVDLSGDNELFSKLKSLEFRARNTFMNFNEFIEYLKNEFELDNEKKTPEKNESLKSYYDRTIKYWISSEQENDKYKKKIIFNSIKEHYDIVQLIYKKYGNNRIFQK